MRRFAAVALLSFAVAVAADDCSRMLASAERSVTTIAGSSLEGDFDRDGRLDFVVFDGFDLLTFLNRGNAVFEPQPPLSEHTFASTRLVEARDVNGDGRIDVVLRNGNSVAVRPGDGKGGFGDAIFAGNLGNDVASAVVADVDGDRINDWVSISDTKVTIWKLVAPATMQKVTDLTRKYHRLTFDLLAVADFDGDGRTDILAGAAFPASDNHDVDLFTQKPDGTFTDQTFPSVANLTGQWIKVDDGGAEIVTVGQVGSLPLMRFRDGHVSTRTLSVAGLPLVLGTARTFDFDHDGVLDLLFSAGTAAGIAWGSAPGAFGPATMYEILGGVFSLADMDGDGIEDLVTDFSTTGLVVVHGRNHSRQLDGAPIFANGLDEPSAGVIADFDGDGSEDFAGVGHVALGNNVAIVISWGNGHGGFDPGPSLPVTADVAQLVAADFDGDSKVDLAMSGSSARILFGEGGRAFGTTSLALGAIQVLGSVRLRPQDPPVLIAKQSGNVVAVTIGSARSVTTQVIAPAGTATVTFSAAGDVLVRANPVMIYGWNGQQWASRAATQSIDEKATTADLNGDGITDVISAGPTVYLGNADGTFRLTFSGSAPGFILSEIVVTDFDGDGALDLVLSHRGNTADAGMIRVERGDGTGKFTHDGTSLAGNGTNRRVFAVDVDKDGHPDVALMLSDTGVEVLRNVCETPRVRLAMQPERPLVGQRASFVLHAQTTTLFFEGPVSVTENGVNVMPDTVARFATLSWSSQPLTAGHHVYTVRYDDLYAGSSESTFEFDVLVPAAHRRTVR